MTLSQGDHPAPHGAPAAHGRAGGLWSPGRRSLTVGLVLTITLVAFEALAVSTIMPIVAAELRGIELYGWVFTAFMLGSLIGIVVVGGLIDRRGLGGPFAAGIALFAIGLIVGGLAPSMEILVAARFLQGLGAGTVPPIAYVAIGRSLPEHLRPQMFATLSTAWVLPGVLGPALAGIVGEAVGWRWVFLGLLPLIVLSSAIAFPAVRRIGPDPSDAPNAATLRERGPLAVVVAAGTGLLLAGLTSGEPVLLLVFGLLGAALAIFALRRLTPAGTLRAARGLPAAVLMRGIITFAFFAVDAYVALARQGSPSRRPRSAGPPARGRRRATRRGSRRSGSCGSGWWCSSPVWRHSGSSSCRRSRRWSPSRRWPWPGTPWVWLTRRSR
jgi:MFS family permease